MVWAECRWVVRGLRYTASRPMRRISVALLPQEIAQHAGAGKRMGQMQLVNSAHEGQFRPVDPKPEK